MIVVPGSRALIAQLSSWEHLGDGLYRGRGRMELIEFLPLLILLAVLASGIALMVMIRKRNNMNLDCDNPQKLFRELALAHKLDRGDDRLLRKLAKACHLPQPAEVFLQPALFATETLPKQLRAEAANLESLREQLF